MKTGLISDLFFYIIIISVRSNKDFIYAMATLTTEGNKITSRQGSTLESYNSYGMLSTHEIKKIQTIEKNSSLDHCFHYSTVLGM
jgi:hypothetical protein